MSTTESTSKECIATDQTEWVGPLTEYDQYGQPTGARFVRCRDCGVEVLTYGKEDVDHRPECSQ